MITETIVKVENKKEIESYAELLAMLDPAEKERMSIMIETAKILKLTVGESSLKKVQKGA